MLDEKLPPLAGWLIALGFLMGFFLGVATCVFWATWAA